LGRDQKLLILQFKRQSRRRVNLVKIGHAAANRWFGEPLKKRRFYNVKVVKKSRFLVKKA